MYNVTVTKVYFSHTPQVHFWLAPCFFIRENRIITTWRVAHGEEGRMVNCHVPRRRRIENNYATPLAAPTEDLADM